MKTTHLAAFLSTIATLAACTEQPQDPSTADPAQRVIADGIFNLSTGLEAGTATISVQDGQVSLVVETSAMTPGVHGFHIHQTGTCTVPDFKSAGSHLNPLGKQHGSLSEGGSHLGDLPNLEIDADGTGQVSVPIDGSPDQVAQWLFDDDGSAIVIHADADDYQTDPTGNAGAREACAVIVKNPMS